MRGRSATLMAGIILLSTSIGAAIAFFVILFLDENSQQQFVDRVRPSSNRDSVKPDSSSEARITQIIGVFSKMGETNCLRQIEKTVRFFGFEQKTAGIIIPRPSGSSRGIISLVMPTEAISGTGIVSADYSHQADDACNASYELIEYHNESCGATVAARFKDLKNMASSESGFSALADPNGVYVFVLPAGTGCISVRKEKIK